MDATPLSTKEYKLTSLRNRVTYRVGKAVAMSLIIGFIAGWNAGFCLFYLISSVDFIEESFSKSYKKRGFGFSLISLVCVLVFSFLIYVLVFMLFHSNKEIASFVAWFGLLIGSSSMDVVDSFKKSKDALKLV